MQTFPPPLKIAPPDNEHGRFRPWMWVAGACVLTLLFFLMLLLANTQNAGDGSPEDSVVSADVVNKKKLGNESPAALPRAPSIEMGESDGASVEDLRVVEPVSEKPDSDVPEFDVVGDEISIDDAVVPSDLTRPVGEMSESEISEFTARSTGGGGRPSIVPVNGVVEFFGISSPGNHIGFVIDMSSSMSGGQFEMAKTELVESLDRLSTRQKFSIYFYNDRSYTDRRFLGCRATRSNVRAAKKWIDFAATSGGTEPKESLTLAFKGKCDAIFLLSDGEILESGTDIAKLNKSRIPVHTVSLGVGANSMVDVAKKNGGQHRTVK